MVGFVDTHDNMKNFDQKFAGRDSGPYIGTVKFTNDPTRQGRLGVNIPELTQTNNPTPDDCIWCNYLSPFYGAKSIEATSKSDPNDYRSTQHSYGFWAIPPDIDTEVLVIFAKGEANRRNAFWIGCVQQPLTNQQVPGYGSSKENITSQQDAQELNKSGETNYGTDFLPVGEKNRRMIENAQSSQFANNMKYPVNNILADQLLKQGVIQDDVRGTTSSSAKRESPSNVFGMSTPGRIRSDSRTMNIGVGGAPIKPDRNPGHTFVMDDGAEDGSNRLTRLRTASGHQLLMHDTAGVVYLANGSGKAFLEMDQDGTISVYSDAAINLRSSSDFNIHSDRNINFHAKGNVNVTAEQNVQLNAEANVHTMAKNSIRNSSQGSLTSYAGTVLSSFSAGTQMHGSAKNFDLAGAEVHFNSQPARAGWGPSWLQPDHPGVGIADNPAAGADIDSETPIDKRSGKPRTKANRTTVTDFVTHEPYDRQSSSQLKRDLINDIIEQVKSENPDMTVDELASIKNDLADQSSVTAVAEKISEIVKVNDSIKLNIGKLTDFKNQAKNIESIIQDKLMNFRVSVAKIKNTFRKVKRFFTGPQGRDPDDIA
jgi:hypothetical protein